ncbi:MAG: hypothetical protein KBC56_08690 [Flavobacterium sp.]|nr:hypothetical protein [Flavobacterium sp.]
MMQKGVNPKTGGLSNASLEALDAETRAKYGIDGKLLDGTIDNSPLEMIYGDNSQQKGNEPQKEAMIPMSEVKKMMDEMKENILQSIPKQSEPATEPAQKPQSQAKIDVLDELPGFEDFEIKDRTFILKDLSTPITYGLKTRHKKGSPLEYFNPVTKVQHALMYTTSHPSLFKDKQGDRDMVVSHEKFKDGKLFVPASNVKLQKFIFIHPEYDKIFVEFDPAAESRKRMENEDLEFKAMSLARQISTSTLESVTRVMVKNFNEKWTPEERKDQGFQVARTSPRKFIQYAENPKIEAIGIGRKAQQRGYIVYADFRWKDEEGKVLMEVSRNEDEYSKLAEYFNSNEGRQLFDYLKHKIS